MAGKIREEDIALVRERASIIDVISEHLTLKPAGGGNVKGLCPFHDEKTPSFTVSSARNVYFCHGCGAGGDAIRFVMDVDHLSFVEAVERLAARAGIQLRYEDSGPAPTRPNQGQKQRLVAANKAAAEFYAAQLATPGARAAREFLAQRGFDRAAAQTYGCGYAPEGWDLLVKHLRVSGFSTPEMEAAGLAKPARSGSLIDRFRRRLVWPIKDLTGDIIGFGARKLFEDDDGPKYLNTPETILYKKSHVLYGIEHAKRDIARQSRAVIVEGYTDVMACHLAGVTTAVATCGTAFGADHIGVLRRLLMDTDIASGEIIFTFDGDSAGQKAAERSFEGDQRFLTQLFVAVSPNAMDPCELRLAKGDAAVRDLVASREPLVTFVIRAILRRHDLENVEGQMSALHAAAPLVAKLKDVSRRHVYARQLAADLGLDDETVIRQVKQAGGGTSVPIPSTRKPPAADDPASKVEREALKLALQSPVLAGPVFDSTGSEDYVHPLHIAVRDAIASVGGVASATSGAVWVERVRAACTDLAAAALVGELAVEPLLLDGEPDPRYVGVTVARLQLSSVTRRVSEVKSKLQRMNPITQSDAYRPLLGDLVSLEQHARALRDQTAGGL